MAKPHGSLLVLFHTLTQQAHLQWNLRKLQTLLRRGKLHFTTLDIYNWTVNQLVYSAKHTNISQSSSCPQQTDNMPFSSTEGEKASRSLHCLQLLITPKPTQGCAFEVFLYNPFISLPKSKFFYPLALHLLIFKDDDNLFLCFSLWSSDIGGKECVT